MQDTFHGDRFLLNCGMFFVLAYSCLTVAVGVQVLYYTVLYYTVLYCNVCGCAGHEAV